MISFGPLAKRLQKYLITLPLSSVAFYKKPYYTDACSMDIDFSDIVIVDADDYYDIDE